MQVRRVTLGIGIGCGAVAGAIGTAQWALAARYTAAHVAAFEASIQRNHPELVDTNSAWTVVVRCAGLALAFRPGRQGGPTSQTETV
jgi:hypothetical protein